MNLLKGKNRLKKNMKVGRKIYSSNEVLKRKLFRKPTAATIILKKKNRQPVMMILKKINRLMETRMSTLKKL
jgi:hypothetical protein